MLQNTKTATLNQDMNMTTYIRVTRVEYIFDKSCDIINGELHQCISIKYCPQNFLFI